MGRKANLNRCLGFAVKAEECRPFWPLDVYERTVTGLTLGYLSGKTHAHHITAKPTDDDLVPEGGARLVTRGSHAGTVHQKSFRGEFS